MPRPMQAKLPWAAAPDRKPLFWMKLRAAWAVENGLQTGKVRAMQVGTASATKVYALHAGTSASGMGCGDVALHGSPPAMACMAALSTVCWPPQTRPAITQPVTRRVGQLSGGLRGAGKVSH